MHLLLTETPITPAAIISARQFASLTQAEAGALIGVTRASWARYESGTRALREHEWRYWLHVAGIERIPFHRCAPLRGGAWDETPFADGFAPSRAALFAA